MDDNNSDRKQSALDRLTDPENITNYLCGYSIRICALYILWIHVVFMLFCFVLLIIAATYIRIHFEIFHESNETTYALKANNLVLFSMDTYAKGLDFNFGEIGYRVVEVLLSLAFLDILVTSTALVGVYRNKLTLLIPYMVTILLNINWIIVLIILELILMICNLISHQWIGYLMLVVFLARDSYRFFVLYSYFKIFGKIVSTPTIRTPQYLTTESPMRYPVGVDLDLVDLPNEKDEHG